MEKWRVRQSALDSVVFIFGCRWREWKVRQSALDSVVFKFGCQLKVWRVLQISLGFSRLYIWLPMKRMKSAAYVPALDSVVFKFGCRWKERRVWQIYSILWWIYFTNFTHFFSHSSLSTPAILCQENSLNKYLFLPIPDSYDFPPSIEMGEVQ